ncbi:glycosyl transferase family 1, partial [Pseudomonas sp. ATCC 13867]
VREVIRDGENGLLVDFFDVRGLSERLLNVLEQPRKFHQLRHGAWSKAQEYAIKQGNQRYIRTMAGKKEPVKYAQSEAEAM